MPSVRVLALPPSGTDAQSHARAGSGCSKTSPPSPRRPSERRAGRAAAAAAETRRPSLQSDTESGGRPAGRTCHSRGPAADEACGPHSPAASAARSPRPARFPAPGRTRPRRLSRERRGLRGRTHRASPQRGRSPLPAAPAQPRALGAGRGASAVTGPRPAGRARGGRAVGRSRADRQAWRPQRRAGLLS